MVQHVCLCLRGVADDNDNELQRDGGTGGRGGPLETVREKQINAEKEKWQQRAELQAPWRFSV